MCIFIFISFLSLSVCLLSVSLSIYSSVFLSVSRSLSLFLYLFPSFSLPTRYPTLSHSVIFSLSSYKLRVYLSTYVHLCTRIVLTLYHLILPMLTSLQSNHPLSRCFKLYVLQQLTDDSSFVQFSSQGQVNMSLVPFLK